MKGYFCFGILCILICFACSGTKTLKEGEILYVGVRKTFHSSPDQDGGSWKMKDPPEKLDEVNSVLDEPPNGAFLGLPNLRLLPTRLLIYSAFYNDREKGLGAWLARNLGEKPITVSSINPALKVKKAVSIFEGYGHFGTTGSYTLEPKQNPKKAEIHYSFHVTSPYRYRSITFVQDHADADVNALINAYEQQSLLKPGDQYDLNTLREERKQFWTFFQNHGYYFLREGDIEMEADTSIAATRAMDVRIALRDGEILIPQTISSVRVMVDSTAGGMDDAKHYYWEYGKVRKRLLDRLILMKADSTYALSQVRKTARNIADLGLFGNPRITFSPSCEDSTCLEALVTMRSVNATALTAYIRGDYSDIGYLGPSVGVRLRQLNVFHRAEKLTLDINGFYDFPVGVFRERVTISNGLSARLTLSAPLLRPPIRLWRDVISLPEQSLAIEFGYNNRRDFFRITSIRGDYNWVWKPSTRITHRLTPIQFIETTIPATSPTFDTLLLENPSLREQFKEQLILGSKYRFIYDQRATSISKRLGIYFEGELELSGNILNAVDGLFGGTAAAGSEIFGAPFAQYTRLTYDFRSYLRLGKHSEIAFRHKGGIGFAYGNSTELPYIKQFFIGGTSSLRPIPARAVGPGPYLEFDEVEVNQVGDISLEVNLEYRMKLFGRIYGAIWADAGNIWLRREDPQRPRSGFEWENLFEESYLTSGIGLRLDLNFVLLRVDYGAVLHLPFFPKGLRWIWENELPLHDVVIGFGYPF